MYSFFNSDNPALLEMYQYSHVVLYLIAKVDLEVKRPEIKKNYSLFEASTETFNFVSCVITRMKLEMSSNLFIH